MIPHDDPFFDEFRGIVLAVAVLDPPAIAHLRKILDEVEELEPPRLRVLPGGKLDRSEWN